MGKKWEMVDNVGGEFTVEVVVKVGEKFKAEVVINGKWWLKWVENSQQK